MAFISVLVDRFKGMKEKVSSMKTDVAEIQAALRVAINNDVNEFNDQKRERYITVAKSAVTLSTKVTDLVGFIRDVERLGERDIVGLKVLNRIMNKQGDWVDPPTNAATLQKPKLHPNTFIHRAQELWQKVVQTTLSERPPGMDDEVVVAGGGNRWYREETKDEHHTPLPPPPEFPESIEAVRERIAKTIGKVSVPRSAPVWHPVIDALLKEDERRREQLRSSPLDFATLIWPLSLA